MDKVKQIEKPVLYSGILGVLLLLLAILIFQVQSFSNFDFDFYDLGDKIGGLYWIYTIVFYGLIIAVAYFLYDYNREKDERAHLYKVGSLVSLVMIFFGLLKFRQIVKLFRKDDLFDVLYAMGDIMESMKGLNFRFGLIYVGSFFLIATIVVALKSRTKPVLIKEVKTNV